MIHVQKISLLLVALFILAACQSEDLGGEAVVPPHNEPLHAASLDLNGDGVLDEIRFELMGAPEAMAATYALYVNDAMIEGAGENLDAGFNIVDLDGEDDFLEITVGAFGPSSDHETDFFYYDGKEVRAMGTTSGLITDMHFDGEGWFTAPTRGQILDTWFYDDWYKLTEDHRLEEQPQDLYERETPVTMLKEFRFQKSQTDVSEAFTLNVGESAVITACDNVRWCVLKNAAGEEGWFEIEGFNQIHGTDYYSGDLFEGLSFAD